jgi:Xaa-Pro aminopeptidase
MNKLQELTARRKKLLSKLGNGNAAILFSGNEKIRNGDVHFSFRQESDFYYLTGFEEPDAAALFLPGRKEGEFILFNKARDPVMERWLGPHAGQEGACNQYGADQAFDIKHMDEKMKELLPGRKVIYYHLGKSREWDQTVTQWVATLKGQHRRNTPSPTSLVDISSFTSRMRLIKSSYELEIIRKACEISANAHCKLMKSCRPGMHEYELAALFDYEIRTKGCRSTAYETIVGGGGNACILHYVANNDTLKPGDLVLIDAGAEYENYAADITRTFPVNGKFSPNQAVVYQLVLDAQQAVINSIKPGVHWNTLQEIAISNLTKGLIELGIVNEKLNEAIERKLYHDYYMHNIGHWLGLDVHDVGSYKSHDRSRILEEGMVLTVEPGLYLSPSENLDSKWWNIGIRIEDDILVTKKRSEVLTKNVPKAIHEIQTLMSSRAD